jgi:signal transduction histidine kinase
MFNVVLISAVILSAIIIYFIIAVVRQQRKVMKWQHARIAAEITTLENERKRIAGDLHDELGPILSAVKLQVNHLEPTDETEKTILERSSNQIDEVIKRFREISYDLLPNTLIRKGLVKATEEFIGRMSEARQLKIEFTSDDTRLPEEKEVNIYRIIQEIVHNTVKHARATFLKIEIQKRGGNLVISTKDDGIGFNYEEKNSSGGGLGLLSLQSRVEVLNGNMQVLTSPGKGTSFIIEIPVKE